MIRASNDGTMLRIFYHKYYIIYVSKALNISQ